MKISVRKLENKDIEKIVPLRVGLQIYNHFGKLEMDEKILEDKTREFIKENLNKDLFMTGTFVDENLVSVCGMILFKYFPRQEDLGCKLGYITTVFTKEEYRGRGYQKKAFEKCLELGKQMNITRYKLCSDNPHAIKMYEAAGFINDVNSKKLE